MQKGNVLYGQSGGPTAVINASALGLFLECLDREEIGEIYACHFGIEGFLHEDIIDVRAMPKEELFALRHLPGAYFGSCRYRLKTVEEQEKLLELFKKYNIRYFFYNGGNDSMDTCHKLGGYFDKVGYDCKVIGIPKTIDNDLVETDHTPGFGSAARYVAVTEMELFGDIDSYAKGRVTIIEMMGRNAGWLTATSAYPQSKTGRPHLIYVPERPFVMGDFLKAVAEIYEREKNCVVAVSEGIKDENGKLISEGNLDAFGHSQLGGVASYLCGIVENVLHIKSRYIEMSLIQRCARHLASEVDVQEAMACGREALRFALAGESDKMVSIAVTSRNPYKVDFTTVSLGAVANAVKPLLDEYLYPDNGKIRPNFVEYVKPFIEG